LVLKNEITFFHTDIDIKGNEGLLGVGSAGRYCFTLSALDDEIVESEEVFMIGISQDGVGQGSMFSVAIVDNDSKMTVKSSHQANKIRCMVYML
jgi:hypothetical protein